MKLRNKLEDRINSAATYTEQARADMANAQRFAPKLLDYDADCRGMYRMSTDGFAVSYEAETPEQAHTLAADIMDMLGVHSAEKKYMSSGLEYSIVIKAPSVRVDIDVPKQDCHKARVTSTKTIEFCGKLDESKYDNVEYLEE